MQKRGMPEEIIAWYGHYLKNRIATATLAGEIVIRQIVSGTPQGGVLSPMIWNVVFETLLQRLDKHTDATGFADDGHMLASGFSSKECARRLQLSLNAAMKWGRENGLEFAPEKTVMVQFA